MHVAIVGARKAANIEAISPRPTST
ncbi:hypothetical protein AB0E54_26435 [Amycolatopsis coloradensis]